MRFALSIIRKQVMSGLFKIAFYHKNNARATVDIGNGDASAAYNEIKGCAGYGGVKCVDARQLQGC